MTIKVVHSGAVSEAVASHVPGLVAAKFASRLFEKDFTLWGEDAEAESSIRLGWVHAATTSLPLVQELSILRTELSEAGISRVVLCGMGGSSLAPEVIAKTEGVDLVMLDSTDPGQIKQALAGDLDKTVVVVSSKSGSTVETDSQKRSFERAFESKGIDKTARIFIVTDPDSPMHKQAVIDGYRVFLADPTVGGRYSALTAFGVVPAMLAGVDMQKVLEQAIASTNLLSEDSESNPALVLGSAMARTKSRAGLKDKLGFVPNKSPIKGFGDWVEQLIAESTGKIGRGVLPVVLDQESPELKLALEDLVIIEICADADSSSAELAVSGELGEQLLLWEVATAVASSLLGVNPFDQPDVESAKIAARSMLENPADSPSYAFEDQGLSGYGLGFDLSAKSLDKSLEQLLKLVTDSSYVSIQCYLNREELTEATKLRNLMASKTKRPVTFGWGPRFLHSTGQYHKGGPKQGVFLQLVSGQQEDEPIPGRDFGYRKLIDSQASGDARVLADNSLPVLVLRLDSPAEGIKRLIGALS